MSSSSRLGLVGCHSEGLQNRACGTQPRNRNGLKWFPLSGLQHLAPAPHLNTYTKIRQEKTQSHPFRCIKHQGPDSLRQVTHHADNKMYALNNMKIHHQDSPAEVPISKEDKKSATSQGLPARANLMRECSSRVKSSICRATSQTPK